MELFIQSFPKLLCQAVSQLIYLFMLNYVQNNSKIYYLNPKIHCPKIQILCIHRNVYQNGNNNYFWVVRLLSFLCLSVSAEFFLQYTCVTFTQK